MAVPFRWAYLKRVVAGAIFGLYMAHLLYFLNPQIDITPGRLVTVTLLYGVICGLLFGTALWLLRMLRVRLFRKSESGVYRPHGFGFVVLAAFISSAIYWMHLTAVRIYLPIGAVRILSKATNLITATAFALLLLWFFERNADRRASRAIFLLGVALIAVSSFFLYQRRESYRTEKREVVVANVGTVAERHPVILVAIRNLPYDWILTMSGEGLLPFFESESQRAFFTRVEPFPTASPKSLWASLATGKQPYRHGVTGRFSYRTLLSGPDPSERFLLIPNGVGFRGWGLIPPVTRISAPLPAGDSLPVWSAFQRLGLEAAVMNWPAAKPGEAALVITDQMLRNPTRAAPQAPEVAQRFEHAGATRERILAALGRDRAAIDATLKNSGYEFRAVALDGFSEAQRAMHIYLNELPANTSVKGQALRAYAQQIDRMLHALTEANRGSVIVICSPSAVAAPTLAVSAYGMAVQALRNDDPGGDDGFVLIAGPGIHQRENPDPAAVADIVPTTLFAAGLPVGRDMDGRVLTGAFEDEFLRRTKLSAIQTYEAEQLVVRRPDA